MNFSAIELVEVCKRVSLDFGFCFLPELNYSVNIQGESSSCLLYNEDWRDLKSLARSLNGLLTERQLLSAEIKIGNVSLVISTDVDGKCFVTISTPPKEEIAQCVVLASLDFLLVLKKHNAIKRMCCKYESIKSFLKLDIDCRLSMQCWPTLNNEDLKKTLKTYCAVIPFETISTNYPKYVNELIFNNYRAYLPKILFYLLRECHEIE